MSEYLIGTEVEYHLIDKEGNLAGTESETEMPSGADLVLKDPKIEGLVASNNVQKEYTYSQVEIVTDAFSDVKELNNNLCDLVLRTSNVANKHGMKFLPSTTIGKQEPKQRSGLRYSALAEVLGEKNPLGYHVCGTHVHVDLHEDIPNQYNLMTGTDALFNLMSSTPFFLSKNSLKNYRIQVYRNDLFADMPEFGALPQYVSDVQELNQLIDERYGRWIKKCDELRVDSNGFSRLDTYWGPVRLRKRTLENRSADTNLVSNVQAFNALQAGLYRQKDIKVEVDSEPGYRNGVLYVPTKDLLEKYEHVGVREGISNDKIHAFAYGLVDIANAGLENHEKIYLQPFHQMLESRQTFSDEITQYAKQNGLYDKGRLKDGAENDMRLYVAERFQDDLRRAA